MMDLLFVSLPFLITFFSQIFCCFIIRHKVFRHASLLLSGFFLVKLIIHFVQTSNAAEFSGDSWTVTDIYIFAFVSTIIGYGLAWLIYGIVKAVRKRKDNRNENTSE